MVLKTIDLETTPLSLEQLLAQLDSNTEILLTKGDDPIARIAAAEKKQPAGKPRVLGLHAGQGWMADDFTDELPNSFWLGDEA